MIKEILQTDLSGDLAPHIDKNKLIYGKRCVGLQKICMIFYITPTRKEVRNNGEEKNTAL